MSINPLAPNQTELKIASGVIFFSYKTPVAACLNDNYYRTEEKFSQTTSKHINKWLGDHRDAEVKPQSFFDDLVK